MALKLLREKGVAIEQVTLDHKYVQSLADRLEKADNENKFVSFLSLLACLLLLTASTSSFINDPENLFNTKTEELVTQKNVEYQKTKSKPEIRLLSLRIVMQ